MKGFVFWGFTAAILVVTNVGRAVTYTLTDLGPLTNLVDQTGSSLSGINLQGFLARTFVTNSARQAQLNTGTWTNLGTLGGTDSYAEGLDDSNRVVGSSLLPDGVTNHAFLWTPGGTNGIAGNPQMKDLGTLGGIYSAAYDINDSGAVAGYAQNATQSDRAVRWSGGVLTDIGTLLPGFIYSYGQCINNAGHVAGTGYGNFSDGSVFLYNGTTAATISGFAGDRWANAINDSDTIVGYMVDDNVSFFPHAFRYRANTVTDLGALGPGTFSVANAINNSDEVVGYSTVDVADTIKHAFIANGNRMIDLNNLLDASGAGWTLVEASAINDAGQIIGAGTNNSLSHGFLLTPIAVKISGSVELQAFTVRFVASQVSGGTTNYLQTNDVTLNFSGGLGNYTIRMPTNTTHLSAKTAWNLRRRQAVTIVGGTATVNFTNTANLKGGDLATGGTPAIEDSDNAITSSDYLLLLGNYLQSVGSDPAIGRADVNGDGSITSTDYLMLLGNYLTSGESQ